MKKQGEKIIAHIIRQHGKQEWFKASDFMQPHLGDLFVGYEASARLSELCKDYPFLFETKQDGRFRLVRMRFENILTELDGVKILRFSSSLNDFLKQSMTRELINAGLLNSRQF